MVTHSLGFFQPSKHRREEQTVESRLQIWSPVMRLLLVWETSWVSRKTSFDFQPNQRPSTAFQSFSLQHQHSCPHWSNGNVFYYYFYCIKSGVILGTERFRYLRSKNFTDTFTSSCCGLWSKPWGTSSPVGQSETRPAPTRDRFLPTRSFLLSFSGNQ